MNSGRRRDRKPLVSKYKVHDISDSNASINTKTKKKIQSSSQKSGASAKRSTSVSRVTPSKQPVFCIVCPQENNHFEASAEPLTEEEKEKFRKRIRLDFQFLHIVMKNSFSVAESKIATKLDESKKNEIKSSTYELKAEALQQLYEETCQSRFIIL
ncbi:hypothetical protein TRFO_08585 [Tritrichomonas foetus]|uniref:Uncharacterized protein n=1 Tax=Tritrichomonas foetus TaxID=1144522 RepID=A0A1J4JIL1_9EUKA|nr:hypothetical protein TRFO_08585 [Tritrichomonas foetus]|eukprot:OHS99032.1 hypothetical protein TRFO_08585 [Tritrichomonas foetus]